MYDEPRRGKGSCGVRALIRFSLLSWAPASPSPYSWARPSFKSSPASHRHAVHPEVAAPAPEKVGLGYPNSRRREAGGHPRHPGPAKVMIPQTVVTLVPKGSWHHYCAVSDAIRDRTEIQGTG